LDRRRGKANHGLRRSGFSPCLALGHKPPRVVQLGDFGELEIERSLIVLEGHALLAKPDERVRLAIPVHPGARDNRGISPLQKSPFLITSILL